MRKDKNMIMRINQKGDIESLKALEEKAKQERLSIEEHRKILWYRFSLRMIPDEVYWNECV
jgi:hypothetical protein